MKYVYSKSACDNIYQINLTDEMIKASIAKGQPYPRQKSVVINGGSGVINKSFITPHGTITEVSDGEAELLLKNTAFQRHVKRGFIKIENGKRDPEKAASDLDNDDGGRQLTPGDFEEDESPETRKRGRPRKT